MMEFFQYGFMLRAMIAGVITGMIAPVIGTFLVVKRYSRLADTLAHVSLAGVALGLIMEINPVYMAVVIAIGVAMCVEFLSAHNRIFGESLLALMLWGGMAMAVVLISATGGLRVDLFGYLFGSILTVSRNDLIFLVIMAVIILITIGIFYKELFLICMDEEIAKVGGINTRIFNMLLMTMAALTVAFSMKIVGILLVGALMVIPVLTAMRLSRSFKQTLGLSVIISLLSVVAGLMISYFYDIASGGAIVLVCLAIYIGTIIYKGR